MELTDVDLLADTWGREAPHEMLELLRNEAPVFWHEHPDAEGFYAVTRYADVRDLSRDHKTFSAELGSVFIEDMDEEALAITRMTILNMDPPKHNRYRKLVSYGFTPQMIESLHGSIRERARHIVDRVVERGECEFVEDVAAELPLQVICEMIGVPEEDRHLIFDWSNKLVGHQDPDFQATPEVGEEAAAQIYAYCDEIVADRRRNPRDDIMTALVNAEVDGDTLTDQELDMFFVTLAVAGNETTRNLIAHGMHALIEFPDARRDLEENPGLMPTAVEEMLRWGSSIQNFRRTATADTRIGDQMIVEGDKVVLYYLSANRDDRVFDDPYTFDVRRDPNMHLSFGGGGVHFCLGANLARLEIRVIMEEMVGRMRELELAGPVQRMRSDFINGIKHMPVSFTTRSAGV